MRIRRQQVHGNWRWVVDYKDGRGKRHQRCFADRTEALDLAHTISEGTPSRQHGPSLTIRDLLNSYINATTGRRTAASTRNVADKAKQVYRALSVMGTTHVSQVSDTTWPRLIEALTRRDVQADARPRSPHTVKSEIAELLKYLKGHRLLLPAALGIYQGMRCGEVCRLRVADVDLERGELSVLQSKNRDWRTIKLHPALADYLPMPLPSREWLCLNHTDTPWLPDALTHTFSRTVHRLGPAWQNVSFHTLRHTCASQMVATGRFSLYQVGRFLGHRSVATTQKYAHLMPNQVQPDW